MTERRQQELALKAVRSRRLTDPLGAMGQRTTGDRIEREARLRRGVFAGSLAVFAASFALVTATGAPGHDSAVAEPDLAPETAAAPAILAPVQANRRTASANAPVPAPSSMPRPSAATLAQVIATRPAAASSASAGQAGATGNPLRPILGNRIEGQGIAGDAPAENRERPVAVTTAAAPAPQFVPANEDGQTSQGFLPESTAPEALPLDAPGDAVAQQADAAAIEETWIDPAPADTYQPEVADPAWVDPQWQEVAQAAPVRESRRAHARTKSS